MFSLVSKRNWFCIIRYTVGLKNSRHVFIQSQVKPKPIATRAGTFSRALRQLHAFTTGFDWFIDFIGFSVSFAINQGDKLSFGFTTLK